MRFKDLLLQAKAGDEKAFGELLIMYRPLLLKESIVDGMFDEDLYQELCIVFLRCIKRFRL
ncbi:MAG: helix-turn-helix domain-containing protein [Clostridiales bacterium]|nr:helix-turn-helix domain-containing protein [Clostridiales bacterium]